ncbi:GAF sensor hybrid histidine kinase [Nitrosococcus oceani ATCC 19707]|uniref:histidine kinase n=2 Tax=Nitrosococcus oceani TaxID=1229 RepID=Q3J8E1_NITOC|nr:ATP-binding protein [Nitrosococcus oceani]ABA58905.1 GAF sensor hybrid histidine kinase [Nitrosococcus oceani ATCC 19707]EDZ67749.1 ATPase, histidine kinase-, DNA gyrase B-, and HSP90-like domain protein [Nitrosococcus oceani AFC27]KFI18705.1 ATPase [Nitrosococcus oceani C-27]GEM18999.1 ATPase [Nitrosococcus oceani]
MTTPKQKSSSLKPIHLLLVEDEESHAVLIQRVLQKHPSRQPFHVTIAGSLQEAREHLRTAVPDLAIIDIRLPDGSGIDLLTAETGVPSFPIIVTTSYGDEKIAVKAMKAGALDYVVKSEAAFNDLSHVVERALRQWHEMSERKRAEKELENQAKQLMALSHISHQVLSGKEINALMREAVSLIGRTLKIIKCAKILELLPDHKTLLLRAATGRWSSLVGQTTAVSDQDPLINHVLASDEVVFVEDLRTDERFRGSFLFEQYGHISGISFPLSGQDGCLGILWACSDQRWMLSNNDISFLQSLANTLAVAIERKKAAARMRKLQNDLLHANQFSTLGEFGSTLAHEVNQPITAVINYVRACQQIIMAGKEPTTLQTIHELMDKTAGEADRAASIIHHLREFARTGELCRTYESLNTTVHDASQLALGEAADGDIAVNFELSPRLPPLYINKIQIQQVIFNLVRNAIEALTETERKRITIKTASTRKHTVEVQVQDTGPGINPLSKDKIFKQRFSTKNKGMGLGLPISHSIIKAHYGDLWFSETPGGGATFHFTLPIT